jgi:flagellar basal-body rod modification protein FlgD
MTDVTNTAATQSTPSQATTSNSLIDPDFNMFLSLLTAQMQNQDPLDPMDTSAYTQQLVQFSQVEQTIQQSGTLKDILSKLSNQDMTQAASFIGREVRFDTPVAGLSDAPATWSYTLESEPATLTATVTDESGKVVHTETLTPSEAARYSWDGTLANGSRAAEGVYTLALDAKDASGNAVAAVINSIGTVKDVVSTDGQNVMLGVNGARFPLGSLVAISATGSAS